MSKTIKDINIDFDFKKTNDIKFTKVSKFNLLKKGLGYFSKITSGIAITSLFFLLNHVSYEKQIEFIQTKMFSSSFLIFFSLFLTISIIKNILFLSSSKENENKDNINFNVFTPLYIVFITSFFIPNNNGTSFFSDYVVFIIDYLLKPIFNITYS